MAAANREQGFLLTKSLIHKHHLEKVAFGIGSMDGFGERGGQVFAVKFRIDIVPAGQDHAIASRDGFCDKVLISKTRRDPRQPAASLHSAGIVHGKAEGKVVELDTTL